jgi:hypothetical protein
MTTSSDPLVSGLGGDAAATDDTDAPAKVGRGDLEADAARSGADADTSDAPQDSDGVPVGSADADADVEQSTA